MTNEQGVFKKTTYWLLLLFSRCLRGQSLPVHVWIPIYGGRTTAEWLASTMDIPLLTVSAALSDDVYINLAAVNVSDSKA